ncbi:MAG: hypothetical protein LBI72_00805 [Flavobacteriaceae bacterium]|jgi:hypothetical protein|nr:hypothetical protein [Flavobacteriaceae bacterium]
MMNPYNEEIHDTFFINMQKMQYQFDFDKCIRKIVQKGLSIYGSEFVLTDSMRKTYLTVLSYAVNDEVRIEQKQLDLKKGLMLMGAPYSGKTAVLHLCKPFFKRKESFKIYNIKKLTCDFAQKGYVALEEVLALKYPICLDGIGEEKEVKHFGNSCDIVLEIIEYIYQHRHTYQRPMLHITTRLKASELEERYGSFFRKMLKDLVNVVVVD